MAIKGNPNSPLNYGAAMKSAYKATKTFGNTGAAPKMPAVKPMKQPKMTIQYAKPKQKPLTNPATMSMSQTTPMTRTKTRSAAFRTFGGKY